MACTVPRTVPRTVRAAVVAWLAAVAAGLAETGVRLASSDPPTGTELGVRAVVYTAVAALVLALLTGRGRVRAAVTVLVGGVGLVSLLVEPVRSWLHGGSPARVLLETDLATAALIGCRTAHVLAVLTGLVLLRLRTANAFFSARAGTAGSAAAAARRRPRAACRG